MHVFLVSSLILLRLNGIAIHHLIASNETKKSPSNRSTLSSRTNQTWRKHPSTLSPSSSILRRVLRLQAGPSMDIPTNLSDDENDFDDRSSTKESLRFGPRIIRRQHSRQNSIQSTIGTSLVPPRQQRFVQPTPKVRPSELSVIQAPPLINSAQTNISKQTTLPIDFDNRYSSMAENHLQNHFREKNEEIYGNTLLHLTARLGHDEIMRFLINETSQASILLNKQGQTPLLLAIERGSTSTAILLMDSNPRSIVLADFNQSSVFHYACEYSNDLVLQRAIVLSKHLNSTSDRFTALRRVTERNRNGQTPFDIAIAKGQLKCVKHLVLSSWLEANIDMRDMINANSMKRAIDQGQLDILTFFLSHPKRFAYIIHLLIEFNGHYFNLLEYSIILKRKDIVRLFLSVDIPIEQYNFRHEYKLFLKHYNKALNPPFTYQTPIQRMLITPECVSLVPLILEQFVSNNGIDLSIVDDCLYARPTKKRCLFGRSKHFSTNDWAQEHPLTLIAKADCKDVYDHRLVRLCVDLKFNLFGNFLYLLILVCQALYVTLYTGIALSSPTPSNQGSSYYATMNYSCFDLCIRLANDPLRPEPEHTTLRAWRLILLIFSSCALLKELFQVFTQRQKYFHKFYINLIELHMYVSAIIYAVDVNECTRQTGIRCSAQWMAGGIGLLSVWTSLLLVVMNGIKFGKHGLLFITVYVTFLKFIAVYFMIWIGYILAFYMLCKDILEQFQDLNFVPKLLAMFIGEYDIDSTFYPDNQLLPGSEGALILYSAYIFTMFIVMMNIMGGLAVADVKEHRLNAKRQHLRARIGVVLGFQAYLGVFCEMIGNLTRRLSRNQRFIRLSERLNLIPFRYHFNDLEIRYQSINIFHHLNPNQYAPLTAELPERTLLPRSISSTSSAAVNTFEQANTETGYYYHRDTTRNQNLFAEEANTRLLKRTEELKDLIDESNTRTNNEMRKIALALQNELKDIQRRLNST